MDEPETFNVIDDGLNSRLDELSTTLENTRKTLETMTGDLIAAQDRQSRRQNFLQVIYLALTLFIALSAALLHILPTSPLQYPVDRRPFNLPN